MVISLGVSVCGQGLRSTELPVLLAELDLLFCQNQCSGGVCPLCHPLCVALDHLENRNIVEKWEEWGKCELSVDHIPDHETIQDTRSSDSVSAVRVTFAASQI